MFLGFFFPLNTDSGTVSIYIFLLIYGIYTRSMCTHSLSFDTYRLHTSTYSAWQCLFPHPLIHVGYYKWIFLVVDSQNKIQKLGTGVVYLSPLIPVCNFYQNNCMFTFFDLISKCYQFELIKYTYTNKILHLMLYILGLYVRFNL